MAGRGPAPKDPSKRRRRNADPVPTTELAADGELRGPDLPDDVLGDEEDWHPRTRAWWNTWRRSAQAQTFQDTDWDFLLDTALMHHTMWLKGRWEFAAELRLRAAKFGATPEDRARLRMQVTESDQPKPEAQRSGGRYAHLKVVAE
jgi:hypothetical protein